jgi:hypothetical protein
MALFYCVPVIFILFYRYENSIVFMPVWGADRSKFPATYFTVVQHGYEPVVVDDFLL